MTADELAAELAAAVALVEAAAQAPPAALAALDGLGASLERLDHAAARCRLRRDAEALMSVWLGRAPAPRDHTAGHYPPPLAEDRRAAAAELWGRIEIHGTRRAQVDLGNFFPRHVEVALRIDAEPPVEVTYRYTGPCSRGGYPGVSLTVDGAEVLGQHEDACRLAADKLDALAADLGTDLDARTLLTLLLLVGESGRFRFAGGYGEVDGTLYTADHGYG